MFSKISIPEHKNFFKILVVFTLLSFTLTINSCQSFNTEYYSSDDLKTKDDYTIMEVRLKNDSVINMENYEVILDSNKGVLLYETIDTMIVSAVSKKTYNIEKLLSEIKLDNVLSAKVETRKFSLVKTLGFGVVVLFFLAGVGTIIVWETLNP